MAGYRLVMAGLVPAIHAFLCSKDVDARHKAGHDVWRGVGAVIYKDLRGFIKQVDELGALRRINGADPHFELGGITEVAAGTAGMPGAAVRPHQGLPAGLSRLHQRHHHAAARRAGARHRSRAQAARRAEGLDAQAPERSTPHKPVDGDRRAVPGKFHARRARSTCAKLPAPHWHRKDGGPFIGSGSIVIMRDPDGGWINASIYRVQVHGKNKVTIQFDHPGPARRGHRQEILGHGQVLPGRRGQRRGPGAVHRRLRISARRPVGIRLRRRDQGRADRGA